MRKDAGGYLTVYMALSLTVMLSLFLAVLEGVRQSTVSLEAEIITDIGMDSILAEYHRELFNQYNLFFVDTSYGTARPSVDAVGRHLLDYAKKNCAVRDGGFGDYFYRDFLALDAQGAQIDRVAFASDGGGAVFRQRAIEAVKDDVGLASLQKLAGWLTVMEEQNLGGRDLEEEKQTVDAQIFEHNGEQKYVDEEWVTVQVEDVTGPLEVQKQKGILNLVIEDTSALSTAGAVLDGLSFSRYRAGRVNAGNWQQEPEEEGLFERLWFQKYAVDYCSHYGETLDKGLLKYQVEYLIAGQDNDLDNLKGVVNRLSVLRGAVNALYLFSDEEKCAEAGLAATLAATLMFLPEIAPLLKTSILLGWAYAESLYDIRCLLSGEKIPFLKNKENWHYDIGCVLEGLLGSGTDSSGGKDQEEGLGYEDYLQILLTFLPLDELTWRMMDVVEMDIRRTAGNADFRMDACIDRLEAELAFGSAYGYSVQVKRKKQYD